MDDYQEGYQQIKEILKQQFPTLRLSVVKNLAHLTIALVMLLRTPRGWYGRISLSGIARVLATEGSPKSRYKRLSRFLDNSQFKMADLSPYLIKLATGVENPSLLPLIVDQTAVGDVQVITASCPTDGRAIPVATTTFEYGKIKESQTLLEDAFLERLATSLPKDLRLLWIMDRGYARVSLLKTCRKNKWFFIIRGRREVIIEYKENGKICRKSLGRLKHRQGKVIRYCGVLYQDKGKEKIDVIVYREKGFKEPWFLLVPADSQDILPTESVVDYYRARMNIEVNFRDFKSCLGASDIGKSLRKEVEIVRKKCRHGTTRTLSVLSIALMAITDTFLLTRTDLIKTLVLCFRKITDNFSSGGTNLVSHSRCCFA
ncbi:MAG: transposase [Candidatus Omnitrophota bacterium]